MVINANKPDRWKADIAASVDFYNDWFMKFAPKAYRETRLASTKQVQTALKATCNLADITPKVLRENPDTLEMLRMTTAPPLARDRLIGLAGVSKNLVENMEDRLRIPPRMSSTQIEAELAKISALLMKLADKDIFTWLETGTVPDEKEVFRAATVVADRLCGAQSDPIIRNAQEKRQLALVKKWLEQRDYSFIESSKVKFKDMALGTFTFRLGSSILVNGSKTSQYSSRYCNKT